MDTPATWSSDPQHKTLCAYARFKLTQECAPRGEQGRVAARIGVSQAHVSNIINGHARIGDSLLERLEAVWGRTREQLQKDAEAWAAEREAERASKRKTRKAS